jgi:hypothetical protein
MKKFYDLSFMLACLIDDYCGKGGAKASQQRTRPSAATPGV